MSENADLNELAQCCGVVSRYITLDGQERVTNPDTQKALLRANGVCVDNDALIAQALIEHNAQETARQCPVEIIIQSNASCTLEFGSRSRWQVICSDKNSTIAEGIADDSIQLPALSSGIYDLVVALNGQQESTLLLVAPARSPSLVDIASSERIWGINAALYGLHSERNVGLGDFSDLAYLGDIMADKGAAFLGINPVHALGSLATDVISPYSPSHRGMLNTAHIALDAIPGLDQSTIAQGIAMQASATSGDMRHAGLIDYSAFHVAHTRALEALYVCFISDATESAASEFRHFEITSDVTLSDFALYETISECHGDDWRFWPAALKNKDPQSLDDFKAQLANRLTFHRWTQWVARTQLGQVGTQFMSNNMPLGLYLDLAVGSRRSGAESWCESDVTARNVSIGAPPDHLSPEGQNWDLSAFAPRQLKAKKYLPLREILRANMRHASVLRIDHVLGLNRSFWIPDDGSPGGYMTQPFDALLAIIKIEAERSGTVIIGEDLGLVPVGFRDAIRSHGFYGYSVLQYEKNQHGQFRDPAQFDSQVLACFATHDTPTVAGFFEGHDIGWWKKLGWIDDNAGAHSLQTRKNDIENLMSLNQDATIDVSDESTLAGFSHVVHSALAESSAALVSIQLDDILEHLDAQNIPGTINEHPNWRRRYSTQLGQLETNAALSAVAKTMKESGRSITGDPTP